MLQSPSSDFLQRFSDKATNNHVGSAKMEKIKGSLIFYAKFALVHIALGFIAKSITPSPSPLLAHDGQQHESPSPKKI